jgi:hypothetical protein
MFYYTQHPAIRWALRFACYCALMMMPTVSAADLVTGGTATFMFDEALSAAATPLNTLSHVFKGTQSYADCLAGTGSDPFDFVNGSQKTVTFSINGVSPAAITGRPNNAATTLDYDANNPLGSWEGGTDIGAFLSGGEQIGLQSMTRWTGSFTGVLLFGDFTIRNAPGRIGGGRSGLVLVSNIDFANATYADLANISVNATPTTLTISGDLLYSDGFAVLTNDPTDVGVKFGTFQINAVAIPEPGIGLVVSGWGLLLAVYRRRRSEWG